MLVAFTNTQTSFYSVQQYDQVYSAHWTGSDILICSCAVVHNICGRVIERTPTSLSSGHGAISSFVKYDIWRTYHLYHCLRWLDDVYVSLTCVYSSFRSKAGARDFVCVIVAQLLLRKELQLRVQGLLYIHLWIV